VDKKELLHLLQSHPHRILQLDIAGESSYSVLATELQQDPLNRDIVHADFHQISMDEKITAPVRLEVSGKSAGEKEGGLLQFVLHELEVECLPKDLPDVIVVPIEHLEIGDVLTVGDLQLPPGVTTEHDPDTVVVTILAPQKETVEEPAKPAEKTAEEQKA
jgi:large subunit ribosomal protein L25